MEWTPAKVTAARVSDWRNAPDREHRRLTNIPGVYL